MSNLRTEIAWWFSERDTMPHGRKVVIGETLRVAPPLQLCQRGLHWSADPFDALRYAKGNLLWQVKPGGEFILDHDKGCSAERTAIAMRDATDMLRRFARSEALSVIHLWDAPEVVHRYLETGDESLRARATARATATATATATARQRFATAVAELFS